MKLRIKSVFFRKPKPLHTQIQFNYVFFSLIVKSTSGKITFENKESNTKTK